jgi:hypothetical protein
MTDATTCFKWLVSSLVQRGAFSQRALSVLATCDRPLNPVRELSLKTTPHKNAAYGRAFDLLLGRDIDWLDVRRSVCQIQEELALQTETQKIVNAQTRPIHFAAPLFSVTGTILDWAVVQESRYAYVVLLVLQPDGRRCITGSQVSENTSHGLRSHRTQLERSWSVNVDLALGFQGAVWVPIRDTANGEWFAIDAAAGDIMRFGGVEPHSEPVALVTLQDDITLVTCVRRRGRVSRVVFLRNNAEPQSTSLEFLSVRRIVTIRTAADKSIVAIGEDERGPLVFQVYGPVTRV